MSKTIIEISRLNSDERVKISISKILEWLTFRI